MNSLFGRILLWFWGTLAITLIGAAFISALNVTQNVFDADAPAALRMKFDLEEARVAYESGGRPALAAFMDNLERIYGMRAFLADERGRDLLSGLTCTQLTGRSCGDLSRARKRILQFFSFNEITAGRRSDDGRYYFISIASHRQVASWFITPDHVFWLLATLVLCYWLALNLTSPVRDLKKVVERFGQGDLKARNNSTRRDELGELARAFDRMATRIGTLLDAERRLLADISHELRSPLARLGVAIELARSGDDTEAALNRIQKESDRLNTLVGQLLQVTRAEGDPASLHRDPIRLDQLVEQLVDDARIEAQARGCELDYRNPGPVSVAGDPELLRRAIENVIRNAIRYSPVKGAVIVTLQRSNGRAIVDVRDSGPGVPEEALPRLFDAFYRVEPDRDRASGGIGLGLSIARRAIELHKGTIQAKNAHPGLDVTIEFPMKEAAFQEVRS
jgi:two-component system sensor histidine kinase CpxA